MSFRKRINRGGFKINVNKSGVGYSWGVKGTRSTQRGKGHKRSTVSLPCAGRSFVKEETKGKRTKQKSRKQAKASSVKRKKNVEEGAITEEPVTKQLTVDLYQGEAYAPLFRAVRRRRRSLILSNGLMVFFFVYGFISPQWFLGFIVSCCLNIYWRTKGKVKMVYLFDEDMEAQYQKIYHCWMALNHNEKFTKITRSFKNNTRRSHKTGALREVTEAPIRAISYCPSFLSTNITPFGLKIGKQYLLFFPDKLLIVDGPHIGAMSYLTVTMETGVFTCLETGRPPSDTQIIATQFEHSKKDGSPDLRYKENKKLPVCQYGHIVLTSQNGLSIELIASNATTVENFARAVEESSLLNVQRIDS